MQSQTRPTQENLPIERRTHEKPEDCGSDHRTEKMTGHKHCPDCGARLA
jgi:hypothetical protein